jgi:hypothetical protein
VEEIVLAFKCVFFVALLVLSLSASFGQAQHSVEPKEGFVPHSKTAIAIAEAVLAPIYGEERINTQRPFTAKLVRDVWIVEGTLPEGKSGGVALVRISKSDGRIISVTHGR